MVNRREEPLHGASIRVLVADDHAGYRRSVSELLEWYPEFTIVAAVGTIEQVLMETAHQPIDLVLLDVHIPLNAAEEASTVGAIARNGIQAAASLIETFPHLRVVLCSTASRDDLSTLPTSDRLVFISKADLDPEAILDWWGRREAETCQP